jgi:hypothetical protein
MLLKAGRYTVEVSAAGYKKQTRKFQLSQDNQYYYVALNKPLAAKVASLTTTPKYKIKPKKITNDMLDSSVKGDFIDQGNGTVIDNQTGLQWMRCELGQTWIGRTCTGESKAYKWQAALDKAKSISYASYSDWRVPTIKELQSLVYCSNGKNVLYNENFTKKSEGGLGCQSDSRKAYKKPTIAQQVFPNATTISYVWSSSLLAYNPSIAKHVYFNNGYSNISFCYNSGCVRLVRSGQ